MLKDVLTNAPQEINMLEQTVTNARVEPSITQNGKVKKVAPKK